MKKLILLILLLAMAAANATAARMYPAGDLFGRERLGILQVPCTLLRGA